MEGLTILEMSKKLGISSNTLKQRITRLGIKPLTKDAVYDKSVLEKIRNVKSVGRPPKAAPETTKKAKGKK